MRNLQEWFMVFYDGKPADDTKMEEKPSMKNLTNMLKLLIHRSKKLFLNSLLLAMLLAVLRIILPLSMRQIVSISEAKNSYPILFVCLLGYALLLLINNLINIGWIRSLDYLGGSVLQVLRQDLYRAVSAAPYEKLMAIGKDRLKHTLYMDTLDIFRAVSVQGMEIISNAFLILIFLGVSLFINWKLALILLAASVIGFGLSMASRKPISDTSMKVNRKMKDDNAVTNEFVDAIELLKTNELEAYFDTKGVKSLWDFIHTSLSVDNVLVFLRTLITDFHQLVSVGIAAFLTMSMQGATAGDLVYYIFVTDMVLNTSQSLESNFYFMMKTLPAFENVTRILDMKEPDGSRHLQKVETIRMEHVSYRYGSEERPVLSEFNAEFRQGDVVRIQGGNGSGKSTLTKLLVGLQKPQSGRILINGAEMEQFSAESRKKQILYINQDEILLNDSVENYLNALTGSQLPEEEIAELKQRVGFDSDIGKISEGGHTLSGGQRKKLLLMKLLIRSREASLIVIDEIEAGLDIETKKLVLELEKEIAEAKKDAIIFKISHEDTQGVWNRVVQLGE